MIWHNLLASYRYYKSNKAFTLLSLLILAFGLAASLLIFIWVKNELDTDKFHSKLDRLFLVTGKKNPGVEKWDYFAWECSDILKNKFPEILEYASFAPLTTPQLSSDGKTWFILKGFATHQGFLTMFDFNLIDGDINNALEKKNSILLTKNIASKLYGEVNPIGQIIQIRKEKEMDFVVTGVLENNPENSSIKFDYLVLNDPRTWSMMAAEVVLVEEGIDIENLNRKIINTSRESRFYGDDESIIELFPFSNIYFDSDYHPFLHGDKKYPKLMGIISIIILIISILSYTSLATARTMKRAKDTGIRKVMGASTKQLIFQFIVESFIIIAFATTLGSMIAKILLPTYNILTNKNLNSDFINIEIIVLIALIFFFTLLIAGILPAILFSSFNPLKSIKGIFVTKKSIQYFREGMVIFLFTCSIVLITSTMLLSQQLRFMQKKDLGYEKDNIVKVKFLHRYLMRTDMSKSSSMIQFIDDEMGNNPNILTTDNGNFPTRNHLMDWIVSENGENYQFTANTLAVGYKFAELFNIEMLQGSFFTEAQGTKSDDTGTSYLVINKKAVEVLGLENPIGTIVENLDWGLFKIIGVINDFNNEHLSIPVKPLMMVCQPYKSNPLLIKIRGGTLSESMKFIEATFNKVNPGLTFDFEFFDQHLDMMYRKDMIIAKIFKYFAIIAVVLSSISLFSYASYTIEQRSKDIGIRKINGAYASQIFIMLSLDFIKWVIIAFILACIVSYIPLTRWINTYANRIDVKLWVFALAGLLSLLIALITVGWQSLKAALRNPIDVLRYE